MTLLIFNGFSAMQTIFIDNLSRRFPAPVLLLLFVVLQLSSCSATAPYQRAELNVPDSFRGAGAQAGAQPSIAEIPSRSFFTDPVLVSLIDAALEHNYDLQIALKNIDIAEQSLAQAKVGFFPSLSLGLSSGVTRPSDNSATASARPPQFDGKKYTEDYTLSLGSSWEVDIWSKIRSKRKGALAGYLKSVEGARAVRTKLVSDVASGYYNLRMLDAQLDIARRNLSLTDTTLAMIRLQYDAGQVTRLAVQQQEAVRHSVQQTIPQIEQAIALQEHALSILAGRYPGAVERGRELFSIPVADQLPAGIPAALLQNRPDVREAEMAVMEAHSDMAAAKAAMYPSLTITAQGGLNSFRTSNWFTTPGSLFGLVQGALLQPIFQRKELKAGYEKSKIRRLQVEMGFKQAMLKAVGEVSDALVRLEKLRVQEEAASQRVRTLQRAVRNSDMLFRSGMATYLEVLSVQTGYLDAQLGLADVRRQHLTAMSELYRALGGGWK